MSSIVVHISCLNSGCIVSTPGGQEVYPWSPELKEEDRANLALVTFTHAAGPRMVAYHRTHSDPIYFR